MAETTAVLRGGGATVHGKANGGVGEHQGAHRKLTAVRFGKERRRVGLSAVEVDGAARISVEGSVKGRRGSAKGQNELMVAQGRCRWSLLKNEGLCAFN